MTSQITLEVVTAMVCQTLQKMDANIMQISFISDYSFSLSASMLCFLSSVPGSLL